jgi:hypothetical protein
MTLARYTPSNGIPTSPATEAVDVRLAEVCSQLVPLLIRAENKQQNQSTISG